MLWIINHRKSGLLASFNRCCVLHGRQLRSHSFWLGLDFFFLVSIGIFAFVFSPRIWPFLFGSELSGVSVECQRCSICSQHSWMGWAVTHRSPALVSLSSAFSSAIATLCLASLPLDTTLRKPPGEPSAPIPTSSTAPLSGTLPYIFQHPQLPWFCLLSLGRPKLGLHSQVRTC